jgi:hypothetical protein
MAKTLRTSGNYTIKAGDGFNSGSGTNTVEIDALTVSIPGNLTVGGTSAIVNTTNTTIEDNIIELNTGATANNNSAGIIIERGSAGNNAAILWQENADKFILGLTTATAADKSSAITVTASPLEVAALTATTGTFSGAVTMVGATVNGTITAGQVTTNEIVSNGSNAQLTLTSSGSGDVKLDSGGDIILDADNADIKLEDGGTEFGRISRITSDLVIKSMGNNQDIILKGIDDTATINALTLDMSEGGAATFNSTVTATDITANSLTTNVISSNGSNAGISIQPSGSGEVLLGSLRLNGTTLDTDDSSAITIGEEINFQGAVNLLGGDLITGQNRISFNDQSSGTVSFLDFTVDQFGEDNHTTLSSVKSIDFFLDSNGGDSGQAFRIYNNTNPDGSVTEGNYIFKVAEDGDLFVTGDTSMTGTLTVTDITANSLTTNVISSNGSNAELSLQASGTGDVVISALRVNGTTLDSSDSTKITLAEDVDVTGTLTTSTVTTSSRVISPTVELTNAHIESGTVTHSGSSGQQELDSFVAATFRGGVYTISISDTAEGKFETVTLSVTHDGTTSYISSSGVSSTGTSMATFSTDISDSNVRILIVPISNNSTVYKFSRTLIEV